MGILRRFFIFGLLLAAGPAAAWETVGMARLLTNDFFGDRHDRWHTHSYQVGLLAEPQPGQSGPDLVELRFSTEVLTPASLPDPAPDDRPLAGVISLGLHGYMLGERNSLQFGVDLVGVGPSTGYDEALKQVHPSGDRPGNALVSDQIGDGVHPTLTLAGTRIMPLGGSSSALVFGEVRAGVETLVRLGGDLVLGPASRGALPVRDVTTRRAGGPAAAGPIHPRRGSEWPRANSAKRGAPVHGRNTAAAGWEIRDRHGGALGVGCGTPAGAPHGGAV
ncbi:lipid A-modifier LpxR family protein [Mangrovicoccus ximenensis]|uniref:lipid A-modifier LpxR family protein n=1 Tax=Mangrovicoccus ximenensis TaxID=1911570 RepID=UPI000D3581A1|nr:lipid A-modifier LpxR family protein [Mangrovicoccus ximenensis]